jgi:uncharacterized protein (TIGR03663 family)
MTSKLKVGLLLFLIILVASVFRLSLLSMRPMHTDEAVHAFKLGQLLEHGTYIFDKNEYHGPTLNYLSLGPARLMAYSTYASLDEQILRLVPALAGILMLLLIPLLAMSAGWRIVLTALFLLAASPPLIYYSRYYIHETLLVFFNLSLLIFLFRYWHSGKAGWIFAAGLAGGLMVATKSTWIIIVAAQAAALVLTVYVFRIRVTGGAFRRLAIRPLHILIFFASAGVVSAVLHSSFFGNPAGIADSITTYGEYFRRAGPDGIHIHPWHYYFGIMVNERCGPLPFRADLWLLFAGIAGMIFTGTGLARVIAGKDASPGTHPVFIFASLTAFFTFAIYAALPYKTPWNIMAFYIPLAITAAFFIRIISGNLKSKTGRAIYYTVLTIAFFHIIWQGYSDNFRTYDNPCNPWVYAHPGKDVLAIADEARKASLVSPEGKNMHIEIIVPDSQYWPLPWYLRDFPNTGWWEEVDMHSPAAPFIICSPEYTAQLTRKLFEVPPPGQRRLYIPLLGYDPELRPGVSVSLYLRKDYYDRYAETSGELFR